MKKSHETDDKMGSLSYGGGSDSDDDSVPSEYEYFAAKPNVEGSVKKFEDPWRDTPKERIRNACQTGEVQKLKDLLSSVPNIDINQAFREQTGNPLVTACFYGNLDVIKYLLDEKSADPNWKPDPPHITALVAVLTSSRDEAILIECAKSLVERGADLNSKINFGLTALSLAAHHGKIELVKFLLANGADVNATDDRGQTAIYFASKNGDGRICKILLENGAKIDSISSLIMTPAEIAHYQKYPILADLLYSVQNGKSVTDPDIICQIDKKFEPEDADENTDYVPLTEMARIKQILSAAKGIKFLRNFRKHGIGYYDLLKIDDQRLRAIGVNLVGVRYRILEILSKIHTTEYSPKSLDPVPAHKVTAAELSCMVLNTKDQLATMLSGLVYLSQITPAPLEGERHRTSALQKCCGQVSESVSKVALTANTLLADLERLKTNRKLRIAGNISSRDMKNVFQAKTNKTNPSQQKYLFWGLSVGFVVGVYLIMRFYEGNVS